MAEVLPTTLFWLTPKNDNAVACLQLPAVRGYVETMPGPYGQEGLVVSTEIESTTQGCLLTFGRQGDIELSGHDISGIHIQILLHHRTAEILIRDKSTNRNTSVRSPSNADDLKFSTTGTRQVVIRPTDNVVIGLGGEHGDMYEFQVVWPDRGNDIDALTEVDVAKEEFVSKRRSHRASVTPYETPPASRDNSRPLSLAEGPQWMHRKDRNALGAGAYGTVYKTLNMVRTRVRTSKPCPTLSWQHWHSQYFRTLQEASC